MANANPTAPSKKAIAGILVESGDNEMFPRRCIECDTIYQVPMVMAAAEEPMVCEHHG